MFSLQHAVSIRKSFSAQRQWRPFVREPVLKAGDLARRDSRDQVTEQDVRDTNTLIEKGRLLDELRRLPAQSRLTLQSVILLAGEGETPAKRAAVYDKYESLVADVGSSKKSTRTIHNHLSQLRSKGF